MVSRWYVFMGFDGFRLPDMLKKLEKKKVAIHCQSQRRVTGVLGFVVSVFAGDIDMNKVKLLPVYLVLQGVPRRDVRGFLVTMSVGSLSYLISPQAH
ncbi:hypothetical protein Gohar_015247 [Gossypium harknessii]|uniref:Uncharacterized protein n=1 Tax=Gossypium harknessii TaxID=34285 RepID=A0A7J9FZ59_9ROSI|nr:hypothetical protein [Gossypium harknessii]